MEGGGGKVTGGGGWGTSSGNIEAYAEAMIAPIETPTMFMFPSISTEFKSSRSCDTNKLMLFGLGAESENPRP